jgi:peroxiredoxin
MKKEMMMALALAPLLGRAQSETSRTAQSAEYHLTVKLKSASQKAWLVSEYGMTDQKTLDSATAHDGTFLFSGIAGDPPVKATLVIDHTGEGLKGLANKADMRIVYLSKGNILFTGGNSLRHAAIKGSKLNVEYTQYDVSVLAVVDKAMNSVNATFAAATAENKKDKAFLDSLMDKVKAALKEKDSLTLIFAREHPDSYISLAMLKETAGKEIDVSKIEPVFKCLSVRLRTSREGAEFAASINEARSTSIGAIAPDFIQADPNGQPVRLSDFRGKYVLLDFWASWCGPCRAENPNVVKAYNRYSDKNFTVLSVSLDQPGKKDAWLAAIKADGLNWTQVSDLRFWNNTAARQYAIKAIPQNFLIDPTGKIIGKNLRGNALDKKLEEVL